MESILISRGVDYSNLLRTGTSFDLGDNLVKIEPEVKRVIQRTLTVKKQYEVAQKIIENPLHGSPIIAISSFPTDLRAKQLAIMIMRNAIIKTNSMKIKRDYPLWRKIYGNYKEPLRDGELLPIGMLILSNLNDELSITKLEKLRDVLEMYTSIPRVVVMGVHDPISFFANRLQLTLTAGISIGSDNRIIAVA
jgi:hypothetical protein